MIKEAVIQKREIRPAKVLPVFCFMLSVILGACASPLPHEPPAALVEKYYRLIQAKKFEEASLLCGEELSPAFEKSQILKYGSAFGDLKSFRVFSSRHFNDIRIGNKPAPGYHVVATVEYERSKHRESFEVAEQNNSLIIIWHGVAVPDTTLR